MDVYPHPHHLILILTLSLIYTALTSTPNLGVFGEFEDAKDTEYADDNEHAALLALLT